MRVTKAELFEMIREAVSAELSEEKPEPHKKAKVHDAHQDDKTKGKEVKPADHATNKHGIVKDKSLEPPEDKMDSEPGEPSPSSKKEKEPTEQQPPEEETPPEAQSPTKERISAMLPGKTIQSITSSPNSDILPDAKEIQIAFREMPEPLRILVTKSGKIAYYFKDSLHNLL